MGTIPYFISDLHSGHKNILKYEPEARPYATLEEHDEAIIDGINSVVRAKDILYILGDVAFGKGNLHQLSKINAKRLILIRGNHDVYKTEEYLLYFEHVYGIVKYKNFWLTHAPIHDSELRGCYNIHGHLHSRVIDDPRYINVCVEHVRTPISLDEIRSKL
jgi:calcineurin-like phosphoesterase family protein